MVAQAEIDQMRFMATHQPPKDMTYTEYIVYLREHLTWLADEIERTQHGLEKETAGA